jgi:hypothetical protein
MELNFQNLMRAGWQDVDAAVPATMEVLSNVENFSARYADSLTLKKGYVNFPVYMGGTTGILYNCKCISDIEISSITGVVVVGIIYAIGKYLVVHEIDANGVPLSPWQDGITGRVDISPPSQDYANYWEWARYDTTDVTPISAWYGVNGEAARKIRKASNTWYISTFTTLNNYTVLRMHAGRFWAGRPDKKQLIYSEPAPNVEDFTNGYKFYLLSPGGQFSSMETWEGNLYVFLTHNIVCIPYADLAEDFREVDMATRWGCIAPHSLRRCGVHGLVCCSQGGIRLFPGNVLLSAPITKSWDNLYEAGGARANSYAWYDDVEDTYNLLVPTGTVIDGVARNDELWTYHFKDNHWEKEIILPIRSCGQMVNLRGAGRGLLMGQYNPVEVPTGGIVPRIWRHHTGTVAGVCYNGIIDAVTSFTMTDDSGNFPVNGYGLRQMPIYIVEGKAAGVSGVIKENTTTTITIEDAAPGWAIGDTYIVGAVRGRFVSPWISSGDTERFKRFKDLRIELDTDTANTGYYELDIYTDWSSTITRTIRRSYTTRYIHIPLGIRARVLKMDLRFIETKALSVKSIRLDAELQGQI